MGQDGAQGLSRQPCGIDHDGGIVTGKFRDLLRERTFGDDVSKGRVFLRAVGRDDMTAEGEFILDLLETFDEDPLRDQTLCVAVAQKMQQLVRGRLDIEGHGDAAHLLNAEIGDDELRTVGEHDPPPCPPFPGRATADGFPGRMRPGSAPGRSTVFHPG